MSPSEATAVLTEEQRHLVDDIVITIKGQTPWVLTSWSRPRLIRLLRAVIVDVDRLAAYCRLLMEAGADHPVPAGSDTSADAVLGNQFDLLPDDELLRLARDLDGLSVFQQMVAEDADGPWATLIEERGDELLRASGVAMLEAEDLTGTFPEPGLGPRAARAELQLVGSHPLTRKGEPSDAAAVVSEADAAASAEHPRRPTVWRLVVGTPPLGQLRLPPNVAERCFGLTEVTVEVLVLASTVDRARRVATLRAALRPAPKLDGLALVIRAPDGQELTMRFANPVGPAVYSEPDGEIGLDALTSRDLRFRFE